MYPEVLFKIYLVLWYAASASCGGHENQKPSKIALTLNKLYEYKFLETTSTKIIITGNISTYRNIAICIL